VNQQHRVLVITLFLGGLIFIIQAKEMMSAEPQPDIRPAMRSIFQALTTVFPLSLNEDTFQEPANRQQIQDGLRALARSARQLTSHGASITPSFKFLQRSLRRDAQEAANLFESGYYEQARFVFQQLTDHCFLCHSQLPSSEAFGLGQHFLEQLQMNHLSPYEQVRIAVAARQFDTALTACEALFQSQETPAVQIDLMAFLEDYLRIVIRVHRDFPRAIKALESFQKRPDVPRYLSHHLTTWVATLKALQHDNSDGNELDRVQRLIQQGQQRNRFLADRQGLIYFAVASSDLHRYVSSDSKSLSQLAEAYYLLGVVDSYIPRSSWISETEFFLEQAIRLAPNSPVAKNAYSFLEEYIMMGLTGAGYPDEGSSTLYPQLSELRRLIEGS
jgi:tetratricopeptide (TPR) repeat protein